MSQVTLPTDKKFRNLTGQTFNRWTVVEYAGTEKHKSLWLCRCSCGTEKTIFGGNLTRGLSKSCGCYKAEPDKAGEIPSRKSFNNLTGRVFGRLTVDSFAGCINQKSAWNCSCLCGGKKIVYGVDLLCGKVRSCRCLERESRIARKTTHGLTDTDEYRIWIGIKSRCLNPEVECYADYGGRGISICKRWRESFEAFLEDMGPRPSKKYSIDRENTNGNYEPSNCRWATAKQQARNQRSNHMIEFRGETHCIAEWAEILGINQSTIVQRISTYGWSEDRALSTPKRETKRGGK